MGVQASVWRLAGLGQADHDHCPIYLFEGVFRQVLKARIKTNAASCTDSPLVPPMAARIPAVH